MASILLRGHILYPEGPVPGEVKVSDGKIADVSDYGHNEIDESDVIEGLIIPGMLDAHTHLGDHLARGDLPHDLGEVVLPGGIKHRFLNEAGRTDLVRSIRNSILELNPGVTRVIDYREGGAAGINILEEARKGTSIDIIALSRISGAEDPDSLLDIASGFGIPSLSTDSIEDLRRIAEARDSVFSVHASELYREDADLIISLHPDQVVHMVSGTPSDWRSLSDEGIPVTVCPRSNMAYSLPTPYLEMMESGLQLSIGTDNSVSARQDMFREMEMSWMFLRKGGKSGEEAARLVFAMASGSTLSGSSLLRKIHRGKMWGEDGWPGKGDPAHLSVFMYPESERWMRTPFSFIVRFCTQAHVLFTGP
ncbi:MAG: amidohydrolase family protein [Thermoplasmatota archaeon]